MKKKKRTELINFFAEKQSNNKSFLECERNTQQLNTNKNSYF